MRKLFLLTIASCMLAATSFAGDKDGTATAVFLRMDQGTRASGMGGAFVAIDNDVESIYWNPAGAAHIDGPQINASYAPMIEDIASSYAGVAWPVGTDHTASLLGTINVISMGSVEARDATGARIDDVTPSAMVLGIGYALQPSKAFKFGFMAKQVRQRFGDDKGSGIAADIGFHNRFSPEWALGVAVQNLGPKLKTAGYENKLPQNMRAGLSYIVSPKVTVAVDGEKPDDADLRVHMGTEVSMTDTFSLRLGYNTSKAVGMSFGISILTPVSFGESKDGWWKSEGVVDRDWSHNVVRFDYAYVSAGEFDSTHRLSLTLKL